MSELAATISWSGDYRQCARTLEFGQLSSPTDSTIPEVASPVGSSAILQEDGARLFDGFILSRTKSTASNVIDITAYDRGIYLKRNQTTRKFSGITPEAATRQLCGEFNIPVGSLAATGVPVSRIFMGNSLYDIISTLYTQAAVVTGHAYHIGFVGNALEVRAKGPSNRVLVLEAGINIMDATVTETAEAAVNRVAIYDENGALIATHSNDESIRQLGLLQEVIRQTTGQDATAQAKRMLADGGVQQHITVNNLGDTSCITGSAVMVREPHTGLYGLFWIDSDIHTWKNGQYFNKLALNLKKVMNEKEAGQLPGVEG